MPAFLIAVIAALIIGAGLLFPNKAWALPSRANPYAADIMAAERTNGLPVNLLGRVLWQESRFREDIIKGDTVSSAGAIGIAQIVPRFHPKVDPLNPIDSIYYAAGFLKDQRQIFGTWPLALAAYNWGPGNVQKALRAFGTDWIDHAPTETQKYVFQITDDVPAALG